MSIVSEVTKIAAPIAEEFDLELWDVEFVKEGSEYFLRIYIDRPEGVYISDCENVSRKIDPILDEIDVIEQSYHLEVCSAGLVRELKTTEHINRYAGHEVTLHFYKAAPDKGIKTKKINAVLVSATDDTVTFNYNNTETEAGRSEISKIKIDLV